MLPFLAKIGPFLIPTMPVFWCLGYLAGGALTFILFRRAGLDSNRVINLLVLTVVSSVIGGRISAVLLLSNPEQFRWFLEHPAEIFKVWKSGISFYGVVFFALGVGLWYCLRSGLPLPLTAELCIPGVALGHTIQSLGDFLAGAHPGVPTGLPWGVVFGHRIFQGIRDIPLHPVMLYIAAMSFTGFVTAYAWLQIRKGRSRFLFSFVYCPAFQTLKLKFFPGEMFILSGAFYALFRFFAEFFRDPRFLVWYPDFPLPQTQMACIGFFCLCWGSYFLLRIYRADQEAGREHRGWMRAGLKVINGLEWMSKRVPWPVNGSR